MVSYGWPPLHGHGNGVNQLVQYGNEIYSAGRDGYGIVWHKHNERWQERQFFGPHLGWMNAIVVTKDIVFTASNDTTIQMWKNNKEKSSSFGQIHHHTDYIKAMKFSSHKKWLITAGYDNQISIWDVNHMHIVQEQSSSRVFYNKTSATSWRHPIYKYPEIKEEYPCGILLEENIPNVPHSIYCLDVCDTSKMSTLIATGSIDAIVRIYDPRQRLIPISELEGHCDIIKSILWTSEGHRLVSGGSDGELRIWDTRTNRAIQVLTPHDDSIWTMSLEEKSNNVISGGRDKQVMTTNMETGKSQLLFTEQHFVLDVLVVKEEDTIWIATTDSTIHGRKITKDNDSITLAGVPSILEARTMSRTTRVLTRDSTNQIELRDITTGNSIHTYPPDSIITMDDAEKEQFAIVDMKEWCTVDISLGWLQIFLESPRCFSTKMDTTGIQNSSVPHRSNVGTWVVVHLFNTWLKKRKADLDMDNTTEHLDRETCLISTLVMIHQILPYTSSILLSCDTKEFTGKETTIPLWVIESLCNERSTNTSLLEDPIITYYLSSMSNDLHPDPFSSCRTTTVQSLHDYILTKTSEASTTTFVFSCLGITLQRYHTLGAISSTIWKHRPYPIKLQYTKRIIK